VATPDERSADQNPQVAATPTFGEQMPLKLRFADLS